MPSFVSTRIPAVTASVVFPIIERTVLVTLNEALARLSSEDVFHLLQDGAENQAPALVHRMAQSLVVHDSALMAVYEDYRREYRSLNKRLIRHRGHGLAGDEEPGINYEVEELLAWVRQHKPKWHQEYFLDYVGPDLTVSKTENGWAWSTREKPLYVLKEEHGGRTCGAFSSRIQAVASAIEVLDLEAVVKAHRER